MNSICLAMIVRMHLGGSDDNFTWTLLFIIFVCLIVIFLLHKNGNLHVTICRLIICLNYWKWLTVGKQIKDTKTTVSFLQNTLHVVSSVSKLMFGVDTTSGSVLYSRAFLSVQPFTILAYDAENPGSFNSNLYSFIYMCFHHMFSANPWFIFIQNVLNTKQILRKI